MSKRGRVYRFESHLQKHRYEGEMECNNFVCMIIVARPLVSARLAIVFGTLGKTRDRRTNGPKYQQTNGPMYPRTDGRTHPLVEFRTRN